MAFTYRLSQRVRANGYSPETDCNCFRSARSRLDRIGWKIMLRRRDACKSSNYRCSRSKIGESVLRLTSTNGGWFWLAPSGDAAPPRLLRQ